MGLEVLPIKQSQSKMRPETHKIIIEKLLPVMKLVKGNLEGEVEKKGTDEFVFCFENCYTEEETEKHVTQKIPSLKESDVRNFYQLFLTMIDKDSKEAYLKDAEDCASVRSQGDDNSEEPDRSQGEASTSHKCEPNCSKNYK